MELTDKITIGARAPELDDDGLMFFVASDSTVDSYNDVIDPTGWDLSDFRKNPVFMPFHDYSKAPLGMIPELRVGEKLIVGVLWDEEDPVAERLKSKYERGFMRGVSVGFRPIEAEYNDERGGFDFHKQKLLEVSAVPIPANPNALKLKTAARPEVRERLDAELRDWLQLKTIYDPDFVDSLLKACELPALSRLEDVATQLEGALTQLSTQETRPALEDGLEPHHDKATAPVLRLKAKKEDTHG